MSTKFQNLYCLLINENKEGTNRLESVFFIMVTENLN